MGVVVTSYSTSFFIPTIISQMGYTSTASQVRTIPIFVAAAVFSIIVAWLTDKFRHRYSFLMLGVVVGVIGYVILLCMDRVSEGIRYMACFFITVGGFISQPITMAWLSNQVSVSRIRSMAFCCKEGRGC